MLESGGEKTQPVPQKQRKNACMAVLLLTIVIAVGGCVGEMGFDGIIGSGHMINNAYAEESVLLVTNETAKLTASDGAGGDFFGYSVSVYNNTAVIGARLDGDNGGNSGSAYVFEKNSTGHWTQKKLLASDGAESDRFGYSVSAYNNTAVIGAFLDDDNFTDSGSAYVFEKNSGNWTQTAKLTASDGAEDDFFGISVSVYNNTAVIGAYYDDDKGLESGSAYIFEKNSTGHWTQKKLLASDGAAGDYFGNSVSVYNNTTVIGAYRDDDNFTDSGSAYVFEYSSGNWTQKQKLLASDGAAGDFFGNSVSVYNNTAVIGAYYDDDNGPNSGSAYVFEKNSSGNWTQTAKLTASDGAEDDRFGISVSAYNNTAVIGAFLDDDNSKTDSGSAYVFEKNSGNWTQTAKLTASDGAEDDFFGISVSVYNNTTVIGALYDDDNGPNSGSAYVFSVDTTAPTPVITTTATDPTNLEIIPFTVNFGENMTSGEFAAAEITLSSGSVTDFTPDSANQLFTFNATNADDNANLTVDVAASVAQDLAGNNNTAADQLSIAVDRTAPTLNPVTISSNNANSTLAADGDTVTLYFTASESIANVTATIGNYDATVQNSTAVDWTAALTLNKTTHSSLNGVSPSFTIDFTDLIGTPGAQVTAITDGPAVTVDFTAPTPVIATTATDPTNLEIIPFTVNFGENMTSGEFAAAEITLSSGSVTDFTPDSANQLFTFNATNADDNANLTVDVAASVAQDLAGNNNTAADQLSIAVDRTAPTLNPVTISSNNANSTLAADGDTVTLYFTASESIANVTATIGNYDATVQNSTAVDWTAALTLNKTTHSSLNGVSPSFTIDFTDLIGTPGAQVSATTDGPAVTVDFTAPTLQNVTISSSNANSTLAADGDTVTLSFTASESIADVTATIGNATATVSGSGTSWNATRALDGTEPQGALSFTINFDDLAGNPGVQVSATTDTVDITVLDTDDVLLTSPGSPSGSSESSSSGSSSSGIGISGGGGGGGRGSSTWVDDIYLKSVSWDCNAGTIKIIAGPDSDYISVAVHTTQLGIHQASIAGDDIPGYRAFVSPMHKTEDYINIKVVALSGRNLVTISESIDVDACVGERTYHTPDDSTTTTIKQPVPKQEDDKDRLADFVDPKKNPQYYIDRYNNEIEYREWFDENYPGITIYEAVGLPVPDPTLEPAVEQEPTAVEQEPTVDPEPETICGPGTEPVDGFCILLTPGPEENGGGCLIATAAYGTELAPQVQLLREIRDNTVLQTQSGSAFIDSFNSFYYSFSPSIADLERQNPVFREAVKMAVTPLISSLVILDYVDIDSESEMLGYGIGIVAMNIAMYVALPVSALYYVRRLVA